MISIIFRFYVSCLYFSRRVALSVISSLSYWKYEKTKIFGDILICCSNVNADAVDISFISQVEIQGIGTYEGTFTATISEEAYRFCLQKVCVLCQLVPLSKVKYLYSERCIDILGNIFIWKYRICNVKKFQDTSSKLFLACSWKHLYGRIWFIHSKWSTWIIDRLLSILVYRGREKNCKLFSYIFYLPLSSSDIFTNLKPTTSLNSVSRLPRA